MLACEAVDALTVACELALECGIIGAPVVMNELLLIIAPLLPAAAIAVPDGIASTMEPLANLQRYDTCWDRPMSIDLLIQLKALHLYGIASA